MISLDISPPHALNDITLAHRTENFLRIVYNLVLIANKQQLKKTYIYSCDSFSPRKIGTTKEAQITQVQLPIYVTKFLVAN